jgi:glutamate/tyrosine decarboxylase-like PLP-dependent enzyme
MKMAAKKKAAKKKVAKKKVAKKVAKKKVAKKAVKKTASKRKPSAAFMKPMMPSAALAMVVGGADARAGSEEAVGVSRGTGWTPSTGA